jgi:hypothetical protein
MYCLLQGYYNFEFRGVGQLKGIKLDKPNKDRFSLFLRILTVAYHKKCMINSLFSSGKGL